jgi:hypothetical protein
MAIAVLLIPMAVNAEMKTIKGKMTGLTCFTQGYICPIDKADPMINIEKDFVVVTADGKHYFLTNIGLGLKAKYALDTVEVTGNVNEKYKTIKVTKFTVKGKVIWTPDMEEDFLKKVREFGPGA